MNFSISEIPKLIVSILIVFLAGSVGTLYTLKKITTWYVYLVKPGWTPPNWVVGPIWSTLYILIGTSLFLIWRKGLGRKDVQNCHPCICNTAGHKCSMVGSVF
jgi:translocator protein